MKIKKITIEGFHNIKDKTYEFDNLTYFNGPNGAGKSSILQALQLALLGYIPGTDKNKTAIFRHSGSKYMSVEMVIDDDGKEVKISRVWSGVGSNITANVEIEPAGYDISAVIKDLELPVFNFNEFVELTSNKLKDWFIAFLPKEDWQIDWSKEFTDAANDADVEIRPAFMDHVLNIVNSVSESGTEAVRKVNAHIKEMMSWKKSEKSNLEGTLRSLSYDASYEDIDKDELSSEIRELEDNISNMRASLQIKEKNESVRNSLVAYSALPPSIVDDIEYQALCEQLGAARKKLEELSKHVESNGTKAKIAELTMEINSLKYVVSKGDICPYTKDKCFTISSRIEENRSKLEEVGQDLRVETAKAKEEEESIESANRDVTEITAKISRIEDKFKTRDNLLSQLIPDDNFSNEVTPDMVESAAALLSEKQSQLANVIANEKHHKLIDEYTANKFDVDKDIECLKVWDKLTSVNGMQADDSAIKPFLDLAEDLDEYVSKFFGKKVKSEFYLKNKSNSFSFGINRDGSYIPYNLLSSGEKCMYMISLLICLVKLSNSNLKLILIDDLLDHVDDKNISKVFNTVKSIKEVQFIFAGVKEVDGDFVNKL